MGEAHDTLEVDVLFVGGGPANLAGALRLTQAVSRHNAQVAAGERDGPTLQPQIALIEKGRDVGAHAISGALLDPRALQELLPDFRERDCPFSTTVEHHALYCLTPHHAVLLPDWLLPSAYRSTGCYIGSLQQLNLWLAKQVEAAGVYLFPETCGVQVLYDGDRVCGVQTGDKGLIAGGGRKPNFEPGIRIRAKITIFGEGPHGTLAEDLIHRFDLRRGRHPQSYALGVKEIVQVSGSGTPGLAFHTLGFPLASDVFGGGFCYGLPNGRYAVGMVCGLDWPDPRLDVQTTLQTMKQHPLLQRYLRGGEVVAYGAKTLPEGGYFSVPRSYVDGALLVGDSAGLLNVPYLKGIHYAMKSGMLAAETVFEALLRDDGSASVLAGYEQRLADSFVMRDLYRARNFRRAFAWGRAPGLVLGGLTLWTGFGPTKPGRGTPDFQGLRPSSPGPDRQEGPGPQRPDSRLMVDKLTDVYYSGTQHREDQPSHIRILDPSRCLTECLPRFGSAPCTYFCPAKVYELVGEGDQRRIHINFANCVHCKTCVIKDPIDVDGNDSVQNIVWRAPAEGGPHYQGL